MSLIRPLNKNEFTISENIKLIILEDNYRFNDFGEEYNNLDAIFATENTGLGGYSHSFLCRIVESNYPSVPIPAKFHRLRNENDVINNSSQPMLVHTAVVPNDTDKAERLMDLIIKFSRNRNYRKILLTQMIELKSSKNNNNFLGIKKSILQSGQGSNLTIVISIDQKQYNGFSDLFRIEKSNIR